MRTSAATIAGVSIVNSFASPLWAEPLVTYPGIQLYTVDKELKADVGGTLKTIHSIGYKEVEGAGFAGLSAVSRSLGQRRSEVQQHPLLQFCESDPSAIFDQANTLGVKYVVSSFIGKFGHNKTGGGAGQTNTRQWRSTSTNLARPPRAQGFNLRITTTTLNPRT